MDPRWFNYLVPSSTKDRALLDFNKVSELEGKLVIAQATLTARKFAVFDNHLKFFKFYQNVPLDRRVFLEVIFKEYPQKPHFDIDIKKDPANPQLGQKILDFLIENLIGIFRDEYKINIDLERDILMYSSHGSEKESYHVIIDNYAHTSTEEASHLYDLVIAKDISNFKVFIDPKVYNSRQQFRILGSRKFGSDRTKIFLDTWTYKGQEIKFTPKESYENLKPNLVSLKIFTHSLITVTHDCICLPDLIIESINPKLDHPDLKFDPAQIETLINDVNKEFQCKFDIDSSRGTLISLRNTKGYFCKMCERNHQNENPFLTVTIRGNVYFNCRRDHKKRGFKIGSIKIDPADRNAFDFEEEPDPVESSGPTVPLVPEDLTRAPGPKSQFTSEEKQQKMKQLESETIVKKKTTKCPVKKAQKNGLKNSVKKIDPDLFTKI